MDQDETRRCPRCLGSRLIPLPRGMSPAFYAFMAPGCRRQDDGTLMMVCPRCAEEGLAELARRLESEDLVR